MAKGKKLKTIKSKITNYVYTEQPDIIINFLDKCRVEYKYHEHGITKLVHVEPKSNKTLHFHDVFWRTSELAPELAPKPFHTNSHLCQSLNGSHDKFKNDFNDLMITYPKNNDFIVELVALDPDLPYHCNDCCVIA